MIPPDGKQLDKKQMEEILLAHEVAELEMDIDATMATLAPNPHYELATLGLAVDGSDAVRETYRRILPPKNVCTRWPPTR